MNLLKKFTFATLNVVVMGSIIPAVYAIEVRPVIGFSPTQAPNGAQFDPNSLYRARIVNPQGGLNTRLFSDNHIGKAIPDINSIGLNFTFKVD